MARCKITETMLHDMDYTVSEKFFYSSVNFSEIYLQWLRISSKNFTHLLCVHIYDKYIQGGPKKTRPLYIFPNI